MEFVKTAQDHLTGDDGALVMEPAKDDDGLAIGGSPVAPVPDPKGARVLESTERFASLTAKVLEDAKSSVAKGFVVDKIEHVAGGPVVVRVRPKGDR